MAHISMRTCVSDHGSCYISSDLVMCYEYMKPIGIVLVDPSDRPTFDVV